jgi:ATP-dependent Clp protease ATP-binding subunit ClpA
VLRNFGADPNPGARRRCSPSSPAKQTGRAGWRPCRGAAQLQRFGRDKGSVLDQFGRNLTHIARRGELDPVIGRTARSNG